MARNKTSEKAIERGESLVAQQAPRVTAQGAPRSLSIAEKGIKTSHDFANLMSSLMSDLIDGRVAPNVGNATCNAGGKLLRIVELQYRYGTSSPDGERKTLVLAISEKSDETATR